ncbi:hypothetical protein MBLNU459_g0558t1 [Dothideomycetes sp. NU459]
MGNDGGSIPTRRELVKEAARNPTATEIKETQHESQTYHWSTDPISREPLRDPVVSDSNGKLYNKHSIIEYLLPSDDNTIDRTKADAILNGSVKSLKDVVEVRFEANTTDDSESKRSGWKCPITNEPLGPGSKAVYLVPCGHAFSGSAIKEVSGEKCLTCNESYAANDVIPILPVAATDIARLSLRAKTLREKGLTHSLKKAAKDKKRKKRAAAEEADGDEAPALVSAAAPAEANRRDTSTAAAASSKDIPATAQAQKPTVKPSLAAGNGYAHTNIKNSSTASLTARVMHEQEASKRRKMDNENLKSLFTSRDSNKPSGRSSDFMTRGFDIPAGAKR